MKRLTLFVKGNVDVHDSLHICRIGGEILWNGINEVLRAQHPGLLARVRYETYSRSAILAGTTGQVPPLLMDRTLEMGAYPVSSQFSDAIFHTDADAIILSIQPDVTASLFRHRATGTEFYAPDLDTWAQADRQWLRAECSNIGLSTPAHAMANLETIIARIRVKSDAPILVYNLSSVMPGDTTHCYMGLDETYSTRIKRFNLALVDLSQSTGISIVDVDNIVARQGSDDLKVDTVHLKPAAYARVAEDVVRILEDLGVLDLPNQTLRSA